MTAGIFTTKSQTYKNQLSGRGREIRTPDILLPKQARYQTALYPVNIYNGRMAIILRLVSLVKHCILYFQSNVIRDDNDLGLR